MALFYYVIGAILIVIMLYALMYVRPYFNPLKSLPGEPPISLRGSLVENFLNKDFAYIEYYKQLHVKYGTIRKNSLPLGYYSVEVSDPEWAKVRTCKVFALFLLISIHSFLFTF